MMLLLTVRRCLLVALSVSAFLLPPKPTLGQANSIPHVVSFGESLTALSLLSGVSEAALAQANALTQSQSLVVGQELMLPAPLANGIILHRVDEGESLLVIAAQYGVSPFALQRVNVLPCPTCVVVGKLMRVPARQNRAENRAALQAPFVRVDLSAAARRQGDVLIVRVMTATATEIDGQLAGLDLRFWPEDPERKDAHIALVGIDALLQPGRYPLTLSARMANGTTSVLSGDVRIVAGGYVVESVRIDGDLMPLIDPEVNDWEETEVRAIYRQFTPEKWWDGPFELPVQGKLVSGYGNRRRYNGLDLGTYHSGLDISANGGTPVRAAAPGRVLAVRDLKVRGQSVFIDHGRGVITGYFHMSKTLVKPGQLVNVGDQIGNVGSTGRSQGNHVHFDLSVGGVTVDPTPWIEAGLP